MIRDWLVKHQSQGMWYEGSDEAGGVGGVYGAAIALTVLQLPHGYLSITQR